MARGGHGRRARSGPTAVAAAAAAAAAVAVAAVVVAGAAGQEATAAGGGRTPPLAPFPSCTALLDYIRGEAVARTGPDGLDGVPGGQRPFITRRGRSVGIPEGAAAEAISADDGAGGAAAPAAPAPSVAGVDFSDTNTQVEGVAEADIVKTDGTTVYALRGQTLRVVASAAGGAGGVETGSLTFDTYPSEMLLGRGRLVVISSTYGALVPTPSPGGEPPGGPIPIPRPLPVDVAVGGAAAAATGAAATPDDDDDGAPCNCSGDALVPGSIPTRPDEPHQGPLTLVYTVDVRDGRSPRLLSTTRLQGSYVSSRSVGGVARLVLASEPPARLPFTAPGERPRPGRTVPGLSEAQAEAANKALVAGTTLDDWFPRFRTIPGKGVRGGITSGYVATCARTYRPAAFAGYSLLSIVTLPLNADAPATSLGRGTAIFAGGQTVYSSVGSVYVTTTKYREVEAPILPGRRGRTAPVVVEPEEGPLFNTSIHQFSIDDGTVGATYRGSGVVAGSVLNQFSMHEYEGTFFIATTLGAPWWGARNTSVSKISALRRAGGADAATPPTPLERVGEVGDLGRGERIYAVRYIGAIAYVVTFRQVDPLYVISLANPAAPVATGELKIPGFSSYLHPLGDGLLLGVGQDATPTGRTTGVKVSLFDVSDVRAPREVATWAEPDFASSSSVQWDHRAFLYWAPARLAVLPVTSYGRGAFTGSVVLSLGETTITEAGRITHPPRRERWGGDDRGEPIDRNLVLGREWLWSLSNSRFQVQALDSLRVSGSVVFSDQPAVEEEEEL